MPKVSAREQLSSRVSVIRIQKGISTSELARAAGVSRNTLYLIEAKAANTQLDTVCRLAIALDVDIGHLFSDDTPRSGRAWSGAAFRKSLSENVARLRSAAGISQAELNLACGFVQGYVWAIEKTTQDITLDTMEKLANALSVPISELLES